MEQILTFSSEFQKTKIKIPKREGSMLFEGIISKKSYHGKDLDPLFNEHLQSWINKEIRWRHGDHPALSIGEVRKVWNQQINGDMFYRAIFEIFGEHEAQKKIQEEITKSLDEQKPLGLSTNFVVYSEDGKPVSVFNREVSVTPVPKCPTCLIEQKLNEEKNMAEKESNPWTDFGEKAMTSMANEAENLRKKEKENQVLVQELNDKLISLANDNKETKVKFSEIETKLSEQQEEATKLVAEKDEEIKKLKSEAELQIEKMPLITELLGYEKIEKDEDKEKLIENYKEFSTEQLTFMRDKLKAATEATTKEKEKQKKVEEIPTPGAPTTEKTEAEISEIDDPVEFTKALYQGRYS